MKKEELDLIPTETKIKRHYFQRWYEMTPQERIHRRYSTMISTCVIWICLIFLGYYQYMTIHEAITIVKPYWELQERQFNISQQTNIKFDYQCTTNPISYYHQCDDKDFFYNISGMYCRSNETKQLCANIYHMVN